jgi:hypothetical protein
VKKTLIALALAAASLVAAAACTGHYITLPSGKTVYCQTCCNGGNCQTWCN